MLCHFKYLQNEINYLLVCMSSSACMVYDRLVSTLLTGKRESMICAVYKLNKKVV